MGTAKKNRQCLVVFIPHSGECQPWRKTAEEILAEIVRQEEKRRKIPDPR